MTNKIITVKRLQAEAMKVLRGEFRSQYTYTEYHARRTLDDPKLWVVVKVVVDGNDKVLSTETLSVGMKRNRAEAIVRLMRSNQSQDIKES